VGPIGGLVHAAGVGGAGPIDTIDDASWDAVLDVNVRAQALIVQALLPALREANPGSAIVGISSVEAFTGNEMLTAYCASKAALLGLTRALAHRLGRDAIRVNAVCPGAVDTPMLGRFLAIEGARRRLEQRVPLGRIADPDELARVVRFLLSDDASYIHGAAVTVDGGLTAVG
jgi:NAD(P)-dependent dehydrogenase (short-subunit alcohol dehydrogenase family)